MQIMTLPQEKKELISDTPTSITTDDSTRKDIVPVDSTTLSTDQKNLEEEVEVSTEISIKDLVNVKINFIRSCYKLV